MENLYFILIWTEDFMINEKNNSIFFTYDEIMEYFSNTPNYPIKHILFYTKFHRDNSLKDPLVTTYDKWAIYSFKNMNNNNIYSAGRIPNPREILMSKFREYNINKIL